jgi:hypothetical protein
MSPIDLRVAASAGIDSFGIVVKLRSSPPAIEN